MNRSKNDETENMVDFKKIDEAYEKFAAADSEAEKKAIFSSLSKEEQYELRYLIRMGEMEERLPEPARRSWAKKFKTAGTDEKMEMLADAIAEAFLEIASIKEFRSCVSLMLKRYAQK